MFTHDLGVHLIPGNICIALVGCIRGGLHSRDHSYYDQRL